MFANTHRSPAAAVGTDEMVDLVFAVRGRELPSDYRYALWTALSGAVPWLRDEPRVGVLGIRTVATERGIEVSESHSTRQRHYTSLLSVKLSTDHGERYVEGTVVHGQPRLVLLNGVQVEAPLEGRVRVDRAAIGVADHDGRMAHALERRGDLAERLEQEVGRGGGAHGISTRIAGSLRT